MENQNGTSTSSQGAHVDKPNGGVKSVQSRVEGLSKTQQDQFYSIYHIYGEITFDILEYYKDKRVPKQWTNFIKNMGEINDPEFIDRPYLEGLTSAFETNEPLPPFDIVGRVIPLRMAHKLPAFEKDIPGSCLKELRRVFIVEESDVDNYKEYNPTISLMIN